MILKLLEHLIDIMYNLQFIFLFLFSLYTFGQNSKENVSIKLKESFSSLSYGEFEFRVNYIEGKETLYFETIKSGKPINGYKLLVEDIHPKGIYLYEDNRGIYLLRILSINNGNVFIEENLGKKHKHSKTTNYVDIGYWNENNKTSLKIFILILEEFLKKRKSDKNKHSDDEEVIIITNKKSRNKN